MGRKMMVGKNEPAEAIPFFQRAILLNPKFAIAYAALGADYENLSETTLGEENIRKAYELHAPVSEPERFYIESSTLRNTSRRHLGRLYQQEAQHRAPLLRDMSQPTPFATGIL